MVSSYSFEILSMQLSQFFANSAILHPLSQFHTYPSLSVDKTQCQHTNSISGNNMKKPIKQLKSKGHFPDYLSPNTVLIPYSPTSSFT